MELQQALAQRRMVRSFDGTPVPVADLHAWSLLALRAPTAGNSQGVGFTIVPSERVPAFFSAATDEAWRADAPRAPHLQRAGAVVLSWSEPTAYTSRYREEDKVASGLGDSAAWPVPYWHTDAAMATMALLLLVEEAGWGATLWGAFRNQAAIASLAKWPEGRELFASIVIGRPDGHDRPSSSLRRPLTRAARVELLDD
jgi:nitroreductase